MSDNKANTALLIEQRDRFVAFAFASAEVLLEVNTAGRIGFVAGGVRALLGHEQASLPGRTLMDLAVQADRFLVQEHLVRLQESARAADMIVTFETAAGKHLPVLVSGMRSPQRDGIYHVTIRRLPLVARGADRDILVSPVAARDFIAAACDLGRQAVQAEEKPKLALYEINLGMVREEHGEETAANVETGIVQSMRAWASGSSAIGQNGEGKYSVMLDEYTDHAALARRLGAVAAAQGAAVKVDSTVLDIADVLDKDELPHLLEQALGRFEHHGVAALQGVKVTDLAARPGGRGAVMNARRKGARESWG